MKYVLFFSFIFEQVLIRITDGLPCVTEYGYECIFPFSYKNVLIHDCTTIDGNRPWCSTKNFANGSLDQWDYCTECSEEGSHLILRVQAHSTKEMKALYDLSDNFDHWYVSRPKLYADLIVPKESKANFQERIRKLGLESRVLNFNLERLISSSDYPKPRRRPYSQGESHSYDWKEYHNYDELIEYMRFLERKFPHITIESLGKTYEGRDMWISH